MSLFEIRHYQIKDGAMAEWISFMEDRIVPFIVSKGMVVTAMFESDEDPNAFIWIRRFDDERHREQLYKARFATRPDQLSQKDQRRNSSKPTNNSPSQEWI